MSPLFHIRTRMFRVSQSEMAAIAGVSQPTVSRWESGDLSPSLAEVHRIRSEAKARRLRWQDKVLFEPVALPVSIEIEATGA